MTRLLLIACFSFAAARGRDLAFDADWRFLRAEALGAEAPAFDDSRWRTLDVPHDRGIEYLPHKENSGRIGPFAPGENNNAHFTAHTLGGIGWYLKHFKLGATVRRVAVRMDGAYIHFLGDYTAFEFEHIDNLNPAGQASTAPNRPASFQSPLCTTFQGSCIVRLRHCGTAGTIQLQAEPDAKAPAKITVRCN